MISSSHQNKVNPSDLKFLQALAAAGGDQGWVTAPAIARDARSHGHELNAPTVYRVLSRMSIEVEYRTNDGVRRFHLKRAGRDILGSHSPHGPAFISPGTPWSTQRQLRSFLKDHTAGFLLVVDPYMSEETLDVLADVNVPIQLLAFQLGRRGKEEEFLRAYRKFKREKKDQVELRQSSRGDLHGRYMFTDNRGWVVDHSLQDLGTKPALILPLHLESVFSQIRSHFTALFQQGTLVS